MKAKRLILRVLGARRDGQWTLLCLDFDLAAQDDTLEGAQKRLHEQINSYLRDAMVGDDAAYADTLLRRRAPLKYWLMYYWFSLFDRSNGNKNGHEHLARHQPIPLVPAC